MYATEHVGQLIQASPKTCSWALRLLLTQLYDPAPEVCELAVRILEEACGSSDILELAVEMQPTLDHLGDIGDPLLLKYVISCTFLRSRLNHIKGLCRRRLAFVICTRLIISSGK